MGKIKNYPIDTNISADDKVIGTEAGTDATKNYTIASLAAYVQSVTDVASLQDVTDVGNSTNNPMTTSALMTALGFAGGYVDFSGTPTPQAKRLQATDDILSFMATLGSKSIQVGMDGYALATNDTGGDIAFASIVPLYYKNAASGGYLTVGLADAEDTTTRRYAGVAAMDSSNGGVTWVQTQGVLRGLNTTGTPIGETWDVGDEIYVSSTTGKPTNVTPTKPRHTQRIGFVMTVNATAGIIFVTDRPSYKSRDIADFPSSFANKASLIWNSSTLTWEVGFEVEQTNGTFLQGATTFAGKTEVTSEIFKLSGPDLVFADNAAALAGDLLPGDTYRTSTGVLMKVY